MILKSGIIKSMTQACLVECRLECHLPGILYIVRALEKLGFKSPASSHHDFCEEQRETKHAKRVREEDNGCLCMVCPLLPEKGFGFF